MKGLLNKIKQKLTGSDDFDLPGEGDSGYVEIPPEGAAPPMKSKVLIRPFVIEEFGDIKPVLEALREGYTISLVNIRPLKDKDLVELKRAINKLKKTCEAVEGDIAGFGDDWIALSPSFAQIYRAGGVDTPQPQGRNEPTEDDL
jgi:SepF-like predicted cell division protein (DUF552 family)